MKRRTVLRFQALLAGLMLLWLTLSAAGVGEQ